MSYTKRTIVIEDTSPEENEASLLGDNSGSTEEEVEIALSPEMKKMGRRSSESDIAYRAFLLWAMQNPSSRQYANVCRAIDRKHPTVKKFRDRWDWDERASAIGSDIEAMQRYRELYFDSFGTSEINAVEKNIANVPSVVGTKPREMTESIKALVRETEPSKETVFEQEVKRKHIMLIDAAIGYVAQGIKDGDIRRSLKDIPLLISLRGELTGENKEKQSGGMVKDSLRVAEAKANNGNIVEAMYEDAVELKAILETLKSAGKAEEYLRANELLEVGND